MASAAEEYLKAEAALAEAIAAARGATKDLHREVKNHKAKIDQMIEDEVAKQISAMVDGVRREAHDRLEIVIDGIRDDLRSKLGL